MPISNVTIEQKIVKEGEFEDVLEIDNHFFLLAKKHRVAVLPYTIDSKGLIDKIGVVQDFNYIIEDFDSTLINGFVSQDDATDLVAANRILFEVIGTNMTNADDWMYLGNLYNMLTSDSTISLYAVDMTNTPIRETEEVQENKEKAKFSFMDSSKVVTTDDTLFLASFFRLFNYFYVQSLQPAK